MYVEEDLKELNIKSSKWNIFNRPLCLPNGLQIIEYYGLLFDVLKDVSTLLNEYIHILHLQRLRKKLSQQQLYKIKSFNIPEIELIAVKEHDNKEKKKKIR